MPGPSMQSGSIHSMHSTMHALFGREPLQLMIIIETRRCGSSMPRQRWRTSSSIVQEMCGNKLSKICREWTSSGAIKYILMEQELGNVAGARHIYQRWMGFKPDEQAWLSFIEFELKYHEVERARAVYDGFVQCHPTVVGAWIKCADFETENDEVARARNVYERALARLRELADDKEKEQLLVAFAEYLEPCQEFEQARSVYKLALDKRPTDEGLYDQVCLLRSGMGIGRSLRM